MAKIYTPNTWQNEVLSSDERYDILGDDDTPIEENVQINLRTVVAQAGTTVTAARMTNIENGINTLDNAVYNGWYPAGETWTYASATTFTVAGNHTAYLRYGARLKLTQTTVKYFYVKSASYSSPNTTVTVMAGNDYSLANAAIVDPAWSFIDAQGFPASFAYTPPFTNFTLGNGTVASTFHLVGRRTMDFKCQITLGSTSVMSSGPTIELPGAGNGSFGVWNVYYTDADGQAYVGTGRIYSNKISLLRNYISSSDLQTRGVTAMTPFTWTTGDSIYVDGYYRLA